MKFRDPPGQVAFLNEIAGNKVSEPWFGWFRLISQAFNGGFSGVITTAKLTPGGSNGSITIQNGVVVSQVAAT